MPSASETSGLHSELFANLVMQQAGMTMIFLGATPHPQSGKTVFDLESAQHFIAQLEMIEAKTRGNLTPDETAVLKQALTTVRMAFVQAVERGASAAAAAEAVGQQAPADETAPAPSAEARVVAEPKPDAEPASPGGDDRKKYVKKY